MSTGASRKLLHGWYCNVDVSRVAEIAGSADLDTPPQSISVFVLVSRVVIGSGFVMVSVGFYRFGNCLGVTLFDVFKHSPVSSCFHERRLPSSRTVRHVARVTASPPHLSVAGLLCPPTIFALSLRPW